MTRVTDSPHVYIGDSGPDDPLSFEPDPPARSASSEFHHDLNGDEVSPSFPVTPADHPGVDELVSAGDLIETNGPEPGKVWKAVETRSIGVPTWTIIYVDADYEGWPENEQQRKQDCYWLNELVAVDGEIVCRYGDNRTHEVVGRASDFQAMLGGFEP